MRLYNVSLGARISLNDLVATIGDVLGRALQTQHEAPRPGDLRHSMADTTPAHAELSYCPRRGPQGRTGADDRALRAGGKAPVARGWLNSGVYPG